MMTKTPIRSRTLILSKILIRSRCLMIHLQGSLFCFYGCRSLEQHWWLCRAVGRRRRCKRNGLAVKSHPISPCRCHLQSYHPTVKRCTTAEGRRLLSVWLRALHPCCCGRLVTRSIVLGRRIRAAVWPSELLGSLLNIFMKREAEPELAHVALFTLYLVCALMFLNTLHPGRMVEYPVS